MKLHDIGPQAPYTHVAVFGTSANVSYGNGARGDLRDIWEENDHLLGLWVSRDTGQEFVIYVYELAYDRRRGSDVQPSIDAMNRAKDINGPYTWTVWPEHRLDENRYPYEPAE